MIEFGKIAKARRLAAGLSQEQVRIALGFKNRSDVSRRETGEVEWKLVDVEKLAKLLGITASELVKDLDLSE